jgi:hypothetical protein
MMLLLVHHGAGVDLGDNDCVRRRGSSRFFLSSCVVWVHGGVGCGRGVGVFSESGCDVIPPMCMCLSWVPGARLAGCGTGEKDRGVFEE